MKAILESVQRDEEVIVFARKKPLAKITSIENKTHKFTNIGFGMWQDRLDMQDVTAHTRRLRKSPRRNTMLA